MNIDGTLGISASALRAERLRLDVIASNLANANTTRTAEGGPYVRRNVVFATQPMESPFGATLQALSEEGAKAGVEVVDVVEDRTPPRMVFDPGHPDANPEGFVAYPNVNPVTEMVDMVAASRSYQANVTAYEATKNMAKEALRLLR
jgi:flagellar basal-body rod protein FlgC